MFRRSLVIALGLTGLSMGATAQTQKIVWNIGYLSQPKTVYQEEVADKLPQRLSALTNGQLEVRMTATLVPAPEQLGAVKDGRLDASLVIHPYYSGEAPILNLNALPGVFSTFEQNRVANQQILNARYTKLFSERYNSVFLFSATTGGQVIFGRDPIRKVSDFSGKKLRSTSSSVAELFSALEARPISMPLGDFVPALQRGVVDGGITGSMTGVGLGLPQFAKYINDWRIGYTNAFSLVVNKSSWEKLPKETRSSIMADMGKFEAEIFKLTEIESEAAIKIAVQKGAVLVTPDPAEAKKAFDPQILQKVYANWHEQNKRQGISDSLEVLTAVQKVTSSK